MRCAFGHLDADGLLARDRREDADVGRGQRVGEVVLQLRDLADLDARREPQLVARDVRSGDRADHLRLDAEVPERLDQRDGGALLAGRVGPRLLAGRARQQARGVRQLPDEVGVVGDGAAQPPLRRQIRRIGMRDPGDLLLLILLILLLGIGSGARGSGAGRRSRAARSAGCSGSIPSSSWARSSSC